LGEWSVEPINPQAILSTGAMRYTHTAATTRQLGVAEEVCRDVLFATMDDGML
jgi:hypothetical protein